jgi:hypothetical protein
VLLTIDPPGETDCGQQYPVTVSIAIGR